MIRTLLAATLLPFITHSADAQTLSFRAEQNTMVGPGCCALVTGAFTRDGSAGLVAAFGTGAISILLSNGGSGYGLPNFVTAINGGAYVTRLFAADVNRDGSLDVIVGAASLASPGQYSTYLLLGRGDGTFQAVPSPVAVGLPMAVLDVNADGKPDIVTYNGSMYPTCQGQVELGNGDGTFTVHACLPEPDTVMSANAATGDLNRDGIPDLVWSKFKFAGGTQILLGNGDGTFRKDSLSGACPGTPGAVAIADLNHDGNADYVSASGDCIQVFYGKGDGTFQQGISIPLDLPSAGGLFLADFNGDGKLDIATGNIVVPGNGDGSFQPARYFQTGMELAPLQAIADLQANGLPDLIYSSGSYVTVFANLTPLPVNSIVAHSAATGVGAVAPGSIATVPGNNFARGTFAADSANLPTQLGGIRLRVRDSMGTRRFAPLLYVSATQINFIVPDQTAPDPAVITIDDGSEPLETADATPVTAVAPAFFTANQKGSGVAGATAVRVSPGGAQEAVPVFSCAGPAQCTAVPIDLRSGGPVYLSLYGTGFRAGSQSARCQVGDLTATLQYVGQQPTAPGLDQVNLLIPAQLPPGSATLNCNFAGKVANPVLIAIK